MNTTDVVQWMRTCVEAAGFATRSGSANHTRGFYIDGLPTGTTNGFYVLKESETPCLVLHEDIVLEGQAHTGEERVTNWREGDTQLEFRQMALDGTRGSVESILPMLAGRVLNRLLTIPARVGA